MTTDEIKAAARFRIAQHGPQSDTFGLTPYSIHKLMADYKNHCNNLTLQSLITILDTHLPHDSDGTERDAIRKNIIMEFENLLT